jgi:hypothetical protein
MTVGTKDPESRFKETSRIALLLGALLMSGGCVSGQKTGGAEDSHPEIPSVATPASRPAVLAARDVIKITLGDFRGPGEPWEERFRIDSDGTVPIPYVGKVKLAGMTPDGARGAILQCLRDANACCFGEPAVEVRRD